jgi:hypothetical protein
MNQEVWGELVENGIEDGDLLLGTQLKVLDRCILVVCLVDVLLNLRRCHWHGMLLL